MNEEVSDKTVRLAVQTVKMGAGELAKALKKWVNEYKQEQKSRRNTKTQVKAQAKCGDHKKGKQTVKELIGQNQGVSSMPVGDSGIRDFKKIANKYGVDFAIVKDKEVDPPKYTVFFKARDADAITQVLKEYGIKQTKKKEKAEHKRPSILKKLKLFKEKVAANPKKHREKRKEQER